jgi:hypothetical protein
MMHPKDFAVGYSDKTFHSMFEFPEVEDVCGIFHLKNLLARDFVNEVNSWFANSNSQRANINGRKDNSAETGSDRISVYDEVSAERLCQQIAANIGIHYQGNSDRSLGKEWELCGVNPLWRGIRYNPGDALVAHYDDSFIKNDTERSLMSVVMYFTEGETHFMTDPRQDHGYSDFVEWDGIIDHRFACKPGDVLVFDHRLFHSGPRVDKEKRIIRTDLMYKLK